MCDNSSLIAEIDQRPLPEGWLRKATSDGRVYYTNEEEKLHTVMLSPLEGQGLHSEKSQYPK
jgi:hypothetical protein